MLLASAIEQYWVYHIINYKCISGLPSFLWPRFPLTRNKPAGGHSPAVITRERWEGSGRTGTWKVHDLRLSLKGHEYNQESYYD